MSSARCKVCNHIERGRIELMLVGGGASHVVIAKRFGVSRQSVDRHLLRHMSPERRAQLICGPLKMQELVDRATEEGMGLLDYLAMIRGVLFKQFLAADEANDRNGTALLAGRLAQVLRMQAEITGELVKAPLVQTNNQTIVVTDPNEAARAYAEIMAGSRDSNSVVFTRPALPAPVDSDSGSSP